MNYSDDDMIMISALQHYLFCPRQCALIHLEQLWSENYLTASGKLNHERIDSGIKESRKNVRKVSAVRLFSRTLGITGIADVVEFYLQSEQSDSFENTVILNGVQGRWKPFPVEYKHGTVKSTAIDEVQLCAQAICLEEMMNVKIESGALFYHKTKSRVIVEFNPALRDLTAEITEKIHTLFRSGITPEPVVSDSCKACSMRDLCQPEITSNGKNASQWLKKYVGEMIQ
ncbi:MAG: CRISPR-associated protein Cas4 [Lentisphaeria bacterium]|nr:CRISPR-associated protein Cas4 [Lentisphaeria bacterium]